MATVYVKKTRCPNFANVSLNLLAPPAKFFSASCCIQVFQEQESCSHVASPLGVWELLSSNSICTSRATQSEILPRWQSNGVQSPENILNCTPSFNSGRRSTIAFRSWILNVAARLRRLRTAMSSRYHFTSPTDRSHIFSAFDDNDGIVH